MNKIGENIMENKETQQNILIEYYTELIKTMYLKENQSLGINARNKIIAQYNRLIQAEKQAEIKSLITMLGNSNTLNAVYTAAYINDIQSISRFLDVYSVIKIYVAIKYQFLNQEVDPLQIIATFDPTIWKQENIEAYANSALEYNKYESKLSHAVQTINNRTKINDYK